MVCDHSPLTPSPIALKISLHLQGRLLANVVQGGATWEFLSI